MNTLSLEQRVATLEQSVKALEDRLRQSPNRSQWQETVGMIRDDPILREIAEAGRAIRESEREAP